MSGHDHPPDRILDREFEVTLVPSELGLQKVCPRTLSEQVGAISHVSHEDLAGNLDLLHALLACHTTIIDNVSLPHDPSLNWMQTKTNYTKVNKTNLCS